MYLIFFSESSETRHALNGVRWPTSNPKCLNVDFAFEKDMENAIISTMSDNTPRLLPETGQKSERDFGWSKENLRNDSGEKVIVCERKSYINRNFFDNIFNLFQRQIDQSGNGM